MAIPEPRTLARKLLADHLASGELEPGAEIAIRIDQTLTQDATGTLVMLELDAMGVDRVRTDVSVQYVDHNLAQADHRNPDDHLFLESACRRFGVWFSLPGNGVSHPVHQDQFGRPGASLLGSDSHTCAAGAMGMLAIGAGGIDVALAMAGEPFRLRCPEVLGVRLDGRLPDWSSAKDVVLEMLRRHGVSGGLGRIVEYHGPGVATLSAMDRHVICNTGAELGATTSVFPSDERVREFLRGRGRPSDWAPLAADAGAAYDLEDAIDLSSVEPLIALPSSPGNVVPVREVAGREIYQAYLGSSANPGYRDFAIAAAMVAGKRVADGVSFDVNPTSRRVLLDLVQTSCLEALVLSGARVHQTGCNGCIGMGQAPATGRISLRTVPRNFPGRSGTREDRVYLCSPETAVASALKGRITDPRDLGMDRPELPVPRRPSAHRESLVPPVEPQAARATRLVTGPNIVPLPELEPLTEAVSLPVLLTVGDDVSTDEILPAGSRVLPFRSNVERIAEFTFEPLDPEYVGRTRGTDGHVVVAGENYGQGSSREHAALAPRFLGLRAVLARSFGRIHRQNLVNFGVLPLTLVGDGDPPARGEHVTLPSIDELAESRALELARAGASEPVRVTHDLSDEELDVLRAGSRLAWARKRASRQRASEVSA